MAKTDVYSWRVSAATKARLEDAARVRGQSTARLLDELVSRGLDSVGGDAASEAGRQRRLHNRARRFLGSISGGDSRRSERVRELVRAKLKKRRTGVR